jgi:hypothetical protein
VRREAQADFRVLPTDREGRPLYQDDVQATVVDGSRLALDVGIFGDPDELRSMAIEEMSSAIDEALTSPGLGQRSCLTTHLSEGFRCRMPLNSILQEGFERENPRFCRSIYRVKSLPL